MRFETITLNEERNVTLTAYLQEVAGEFRNITARPAVLVLPGGGYSFCSDREADPVALAYARAGYQVFILRYSVGKYASWPQPLKDYDEAMALIRANAEKWTLYPDKVAVVGFSAGGHLAASAATMAENRPNAAILGYAVTEGESVHGRNTTAPDTVSAVDGKTCPCFLFATRTDEIVPVRNTLSFALALDRAGIGFETHIYAYGPHGFSVCDDSVLTPGTGICNRAASWVADSIGWLKDVFGEFGNGEMSAPRAAAKINTDDAEYLSIDCTIGHLMKNPAAREILVPMMAAARERTAKEYGGQIPGNGTGSSEDKSNLGMKMTLRSALGYASVPAAYLEQLNAALSKIPNK